MTRSDLVARLAALHGIEVQEAGHALAAVLDAIGAGLSQGDRIELCDFGVFSRQGRSA